MTPKAGKVHNHYVYLLTGEEEKISEDDIEALNHWLDDSEKGVTVPIASSKVTGNDIELANEMVTYYCRHRHNDWSKEWIEKNLHGDDLSSYKGFRHELIKLCQSHHYGREELEQSSFNPRIVGQQGEVVHLRYLACVLRIADVLEFDPERTPDVILRQRDIAEDSLIYWHKDHDISFAKENNRLLIIARPTNAIVHKAIDDTCDQIDHELQLCRMLSETTHFEICPGLHNKLPHEWTLVSTVHRDLKARDDVYEYIDGAFRPNTQKILEMLSGIELYGEVLTSVRELLQNAFDAVREQIAYERLKKPCPSDKHWAETLGKLHKVELRFEKREDEFWLVCSDTGVGMNKRIIRKHLLISGQPRRHDILSLERKCHDVGFNLGRTGKFGVGVLSYFMIADRLTITTRRSLNPKDGDSNGWIFETRGIGAFGELRRDVNAEAGSKIELRLRKACVCNEAKEWYRKLREYLVSLLRYVPCEFQLNSAIAGCEPLDIKPGWTDNLYELNKNIKNGIRTELCTTRSTDNNLLPKSIRNELVAESNKIDEIISKASQCLKWACKEGELPDRTGRFRFQMPYFELTGGRSLVFLDDEKNGEELTMKKFLGSYYYASQAFTTVSWKGMRTNMDDYGYGRYRHGRYGHGSTTGVNVELDLCDENVGIPHVSRNVITLKAEGTRVLEWSRKKTMEFRDEFVKENMNSRYNLLNCQKANASIVIEKPQWPGVAVNEAGDRKLQEIKFPAVNITLSGFSYEPLNKPKYRGKTVTLLSPIQSKDEYSYGEGIHGIDLNSCPNKIIVLEYRFDYRLIPLWEKSPYKRERQPCEAIKLAAFPPKWKNLIGVLFAKRKEMIWNKDLSLLKHIKEDDRRWARENTEQTDPLSIQDILLNDRGRAIAWLLSFVGTEQKDIWNALPERAPNFLTELWRVVFNITGRPQVFKPIVLWVEGLYGSSQLKVLLPSGWNEKRSSLEQYLPDPGENWKLISEEETERSKVIKKRSGGKRVAVRKKVAKKKAKKKKAVKKATRKIAKKAVSKKAKKK